VKNGGQVRTVTQFYAFSLAYLMEPELHRRPIRFYEIDLLRFLAALTVVFYHYTYRGFQQGHYSPIAYPELGRLTRYGWLGVRLFFLISGYVVLLSAQGKTVRQFFLARVTRLYPAFWVACTLTFLVKRFFGPMPADGLMSPLHATFGQYVANMTMLPEFMAFPLMDEAYWSLTIELTFYFLIGLLIATKLLKHLEVVLAAWLGYAAVALSGIGRGGVLFPSLLFPAYAPYFVAGMLFYLLQQPKGRTPLRWGLLLVAYLLSVRAIVQASRRLALFFADTMSSAVSVAVLTSFFVIFYLVAFRKLNLNRFTWLAWLGALTYPLYLIHSDIGFIVFTRAHHLFNKYVLLALLLGGCLLTAYLIHRFAEKPLSKPLGGVVNRLLNFLLHRLTEPD
jgi:peptidoglycan/LPS O-acetylase OafA/YrhL